MPEVDVITVQNNDEKRSSEPTFLARASAIRTPRHLRAANNPASVKTRCNQSQNNAHYFAAVVSPDWQVARLGWLFNVLKSLQKKEIISYPYGWVASKRKLKGFITPANGNCRWRKNLRVKHTIRFYYSTQLMNRYRKKILRILRPF